MFPIVLLRLRHRFHGHHYRTHTICYNTKINSVNIPVLNTHGILSSMELNWTGLDGGGSSYLPSVVSLVLSSKNAPSDYNFGLHFAVEYIFLPSENSTPRTT